MVTSCRPHQLMFVKRHINTCQQETPTAEKEKSKETSARGSESHGVERGEIMLSNCMSGMSHLFSHHYKPQEPTTHHRHHSRNTSERHTHHAYHMQTEPVQIVQRHRHAKKKKNLIDPRRRRPLEHASIVRNIHSVFTHAPLDELSGS